MKFFGGQKINSNVPLELQESDFGDLDDMQNKLICKLNALDLVLLENANELFRVLMQEGDNNNNIEKVLKLISKERKHSIFLPSRTFDIKMNSKDNWVFDQKSTNKRMLYDYICECNKITDGKIKEDSIIFTIIGLDLGEGGHYGGIVCDIKLKTIYVFDSMGGDFNGESQTAATQKIFKGIAKKMFIGDNSYSCIEGVNDMEFEIENVHTDYVLQPTGGFEEYIAPILNELDTPKNKELLRDINLQHTESQNHFCYIWSIWFCNIYLRGKIDLYNTIINDFKNKNIIPLVVIKKYILNIMQFLEDVQHKRFFYKRFAQIWSNHENPLQNDFKLYEINWKKPTNIQDCLTNSIINLQVKQIESTPYKIKHDVCK